MPQLILRVGVAALACVLCSVSFADEADMARGISDEQLAAIGQRWAEALSDSNAAGVRAVLDAEGLGMRSAASFPASDTTKAEFVRGFVSGADRMVQGWITEIENAEGEARFLKVHTLNGMRGPLVRYDLGEQGYNYVLLIVANGAGAAPRVVDLFVASNGQKLSESLGALTLLIMAPSESLIGRVFGLTTVDQDLAALFRTIGRLRLQGKFDEAYALVVQMPEQIRNSRIMLNLSLQLANPLGEDVYREELARLAKYHSDDPTAAFALIDYYVYNGDTDAAMKAALSMEKAFGADAAIAELKAAIALTAGDLAGARRHAQQGVSLEPTNESIRWTLLSILMRAEQYAEGIQVIEGLEADFDYDLAGASFADNEVYGGFVKSPEYAAWLAKRPGERR